MALVDLLNLGSYYGSEELPWAHHHIITVSKDYYIQVKSLLEPITISNSNEMLNFHSDVLCGVRVYGNQFAVSCRDNTFTIWNMHLEYKPYFHLDVSLVRSITGPRDIFFNFGFWRNEVYCVSRKGGLNVYSKDKEEWIEKKHFMILYSNECLESVVSVTAVFLFRNQIIIMLTADGKMVVYVNEQMVRHHYLMKYLHTVLVTVALSGTILALGGENGKLFLYHIPDDDHLGSLQLSNPAFALQLSDASIIAIDILHDNDSPVIVAATNESIYVIKWYNIHKSHQEVKRRDVSHLFKMH
ncbi:uncharacterized protein LOC118193410 isoform X2 [Stegodyphus dumicola]|nr:uncharacterized protein LOC118193410 isoform X2 [Stegodyphus dumicola]